MVALQRRHPRFGCPRIAMQWAQTLGVDIDQEVVRRVLAQHSCPRPKDHGPAWLTRIGDMQDSRWSVDLFRCESIRRQTHGGLLVMDQLTRRIIGGGVQAGDVDGVALCRLFHRASSGRGTPRYLSTDHDPLVEYHRWQVNLCVLEVEEIKTVPHVPHSHPVIERLIGTVRREFLDPIFFWNARDLERKLAELREYLPPTAGAQLARRGYAGASER